jgi:hypothetical protein
VVLGLGLELGGSWTISSPRREEGSGVEQASKKVEVKEYREREREVKKMNNNSFFVLLDYKGLKER